MTYGCEMRDTKKAVRKRAKPNQTRAKESPPEKNTTSKKELLTITLGCVAEGRS
jgi:hypothetical protein